MPTVQKPLFERVTGTGGATSISTSAVPEGKSRVIVAASGTHTAAAGLVMEWMLSYDASRYMGLQNSALNWVYTSANPGIVPANTRFPLIGLPLFMVGGQFLSLLAAVGALETLEMNISYYEWYHDFEPIPWQLRLY